MLKELIMMHSAEIGLVLFLLSFLVILSWSVTRSRKEVDHWSSLPLAQTIERHPAEREQQP